MNKIYPQSPTEERNVFGVSFHSPTEGYVAFTYSIGFTSDGGKTFVERPISPTNINFNTYPPNPLAIFNAQGVHAFNNQELIVYGTLGIGDAVLYSSDNGRTFTLTYYNVDPTFSDGMIHQMKFIGNTAFAIQFNKILRSTNKGQSWSVVRDVANSNFSAISLIDASTVFIADNQSILKSTNGGTNWQTIATPFPVISGFFLNNLEGWISTENRRVFKTLDGGANWVRVSNDGQDLALEKMHFSDYQNGYAYDSRVDGGLFKTTDGGVYWEKIPYSGNNYQNESLLSMFVLDNNRLWAGTYNGLFQSTDGGGITLPVASFSIDTTGYAQTATVKLINHSKPSYTTTWLRNGVQFSTAQSPSYTRDNSTNIDIISLIVSNGKAKDTLTISQEFILPVRFESFSPASAPGGTAVIIKGKNFKEVTSVSFGGQPAAGFTLISETEIHATVGTGASGDIRIVTARSGTASLPGFVFLPPPTFTKFTPASDIAGNPMIITGTNFLEVQSVLIGGVNASFSVINSTTIQARIPSGGSGSVKIIARAGTVELPGYIAKPSAFAFTAISETEAGWMKIRGSSLSEITSITIGGIPVQSFRIVNPDSIVAVIGKGATGNILLTAPGGTATLSGFTYLIPPVITGFNPSEGPVGTTVTITGSQFDPVPGNNIVRFGAVKAVVKTASANSLTVEVPAGASLQPLSVQKGTLAAWASQAFRVTYPGGAYAAPNSFIKHSIDANGISYFKIIQATDMDADGKPDLVTVTDGENGPSLAIFPNNSTPAQMKFGAPVWQKVEGTNSFVTSDFNRDGKTDIILQTGNGDLVYYSNTSTPGSISIKEAGGYPNAGAGIISVSDIDKDGKPDILTRSNSIVSVFRNIGEAGAIAFDQPLSLNINGGYHEADLDNDGDIDLITINSDRSGSIYLNESTPGRIKFTKKDGFSTTGFASIQTGDMNGDGKTDIIIHEFEPDNKVRVFINTTSGGNLSFAAPMLLDPITNPYKMALADLDGDGKTDMIVTSDDAYLSTWHNKTTGNTLAFSGRMQLIAGLTDYRGDFILAGNDLNGDGKTDLLIRGKDLSQIEIYQNDCTPKPYIASFESANAVSGETIIIKGAHFTGTTKVSFGSVDAASFSIVSDSLIRAVVGTGATGAVSVTNAHGTYSIPGFIYGAVPRITSVNPAAAAAGTPVIISGAGFGGTVNDNIVYFGGVRATVTAASSGQLTVTVPKGAAPGLITVTANRLTGYSKGDFVVTFPGDTSQLRESSFDKSDYLESRFTSIVDIDNDGKQDMLLLKDAGKLFAAKNTSNPGTISFASPVAIPGIAGTAMATSDLDGDGKVDVVVLQNDNQAFAYHKNISTPAGIAFTAAVLTSYPSPQIGDYNQIRVHDLDGDGRPDVLISNSYNHTLYYFKNLSDAGGIRFAPVYILRESIPKDICIVDVDRDGIPEIMLLGRADGNEYLKMIKHIPGSSVTGFTSTRITSFSSSTETISSSDLDGDGMPDLLTGNGGYYLGVIFYRNTTITEPFTYMWEHITGLRNAYNYYTTAGDLNGDGRPDVVAGLSNYLLFMKNQSKPGEMKFDTTYKEWISFSQAKVLYADLDLDGVLDLAIQQYGGITPMRNRLGDITMQHVCKGTNSSLGAGMDGNTYQWQWNTGNGFIDIGSTTGITGSTTNTLQLQQVPMEWNNYLFRCLVDGKAGRSFKLVVNGTVLTPSVRIDVDTELCNGVHPSPRAKVTNGGQAPVFHWWVNGIDKGTGPDFINLPALYADVTLKVELTSSEACVTSSKATAEVLIKMIQSSRPVVTVTPSKQSICAGEEVVYTASVNDNLIPVSYKWKKNGQVVGGNSSTYTDHTITSTDEIKVDMIVQPVCLGGTEATGTAAKVVVKAPLTPIVILQYSAPDPLNNVYAVTAVVADAGPVQSWQWWDSTRNHGWQPIAGATEGSLTYTPGTSGDKVKCVVRLMLNCGNAITTIESETASWNLNPNARLSPNPVRDVLYIDEINTADGWKKLEVVNLSNGAVVIAMDASNKKSIRLSVAQLVPGTYAVVLRGPSKKPLRLRFLKL